MWGSVSGKIMPTLGGAWQLVFDRPVMVALYLALLLPSFVLLCRGLWRHDGRQAYWWGVAIVLVNTVFSWGDDSYSHVYRIAALTEEFSAGRPGMLLTNPTTGQVLPVFVFYSVLPYLPPTLLNLAGVPAVVAFKLALCVQFLVLAWGLQALIDQTREAGSTARRVTADFLVAILFIQANYVYTLWCTRAALAELWVYSFIPWVAAAILRPGGGRALVALFLLQAIAHPIVLAQALICEVAVPYCLSRLDLRELVRRWLPPLLVALVLAAPFWLVQFLWKGDILGPAALPGRFEDSFRPLLDLVHARDFRSIGPWMPLALVVAAIGTRGRLGLRVWAVTGLMLLMLLLQWTAISGLVARIPVLNLSVFVWRLMLPAAFLAFGAVLAGWRRFDRPPVALLGALAVASVLAMFWVSLGPAPSYFEKLANAPDQRGALVDYNRGGGVWGIREFQPNYARLPALCPAEAERQAVSYNDVRRGVVAQKPYVVVTDGPVGFVSYTAPTSACRDDLVLGPLKPGDLVKVSERNVDWLFVARMVELALLAAVGLFLFLPRRRHA